MSTLYIDECKQKPYLLTATLVLQRENSVARRALRQLLLPGQRSLDFKSENSRRKRQILGVLIKLNFKLLVIKCDALPRHRTRNCAFESLLAYRNAYSISHLVIELDETVRVTDNQLLKQLQEPLLWDHRHRHEEPLLWVADAAAWCVNRGGEWERMVRPLIIETVTC